VKQIADVMLVFSYFVGFCIFFKLQVGVSVSYAIWACSRNFTIFVLARIIGGLFKGNVTISTAIVTDVTSTVNRGKGMVRFKHSLNISLTVNPQISPCIKTLPHFKGNLLIKPPTQIIPSVFLRKKFIIINLLLFNPPAPTPAPTLIQKPLRIRLVA
jgi:hypothetical protein